MAIDYDGELTCSLSVTDLDRSIAWYQDVLGFTLIYRMEAVAWCELKTSVPGVNLGLGQVETVKRGGGATPTFGVTDMAAAKAALDAAEIPQDGAVIEVPDFVRLLTFFDPDGNALMFYQDIRIGFRRGAT